MSRIDSNEEQTVKSFGNKWNHEASIIFGLTETDDQLIQMRTKFLSIFGVDNIDDLNNIFLDDMVCLNAGCGIAWAEYLFNINKNVTRYAIDYSDSVETAKILTEGMDNVIIMKEDIFELPFEDSFFDIIFSDGVIHHTGDAKKAFKTLCTHLKTGGLIGIYVYCTKPFIRKIVDKNLREITTDMSFDECLVFSNQIAKLGRSLQKINKIVVIEEDIPLLNISKGEYELQKFVYDFIIKCYYNDIWGLEFSSIVNLDWYHPKNVSFHTLEEVLKWFNDNDITNIKIIQPKGYEYSGYYISGRKC